LEKGREWEARGGREKAKFQHEFRQGMPRGQPKGGGGVGGRRNRWGGDASWGKKGDKLFAVHRLGGWRIPSHFSRGKKDKTFLRKGKIGEYGEGEGSIQIRRFDRLEKVRTGAEKAKKRPAGQL